MWQNPDRGVWRVVQVNGGFGGLRVVKALASDHIYPSFCYKIRHRLDLAATPPLAGAFRELLQTNPKNAKQFGIVDWKEAFKKTADELYKALKANLAAASPIATLGSDQGYWTTAANFILRVKSKCSRNVSPQSRYNWLPPFTPFRDVASFVGNPSTGMRGLTR